MSKYRFAVILAAFAILLLAAWPSVSAAEEADGTATSAHTVGSAIITTGESWCEEGQRAVRKALLFVNRGEDGKLNEVRTHSWMETTGESCEMTRGDSGGAPGLPEASTEQMEALKKDATKRAEAEGEGEQTRGYWCSDSCQYTRGQYECWYGNYYWVDYCYNECDDYTGQYYYWWKSYC